MQLVAARLGEDGGVTGSQAFDQETETSRGPHGDRRRDRLGRHPASRLRGQFGVGHRQHDAQIRMDLEPPDLAPR
jgi:hypothetical protein